MENLNEHESSSSLGKSFKSMLKLHEESSRLHLVQRGENSN